MLPLEIRNRQSVKSVVINNNNNAARLQVHYTKCSMDSVSSAERIISNFGNIHTKLCNLVGNNKAFKLVFCYKILRGRVC